MPGGITRFGRLHARLLSYVTGGVLVTVWTLLRFFTQRTIFDLVGQQVLAQQWLHGGIAGAGVGVTNYLPKLFLLYIPLVTLPGSPRLKLVILTVLVNLVTYILLGLILEKLLREFGVRAGATFYGALVWLGAIAGSVFWIQFTNSRNLEVVGGVFLLYQGICYLKRPSWQRLAGLTLFCILLFFSDTLQFYMTAIPLVLYGLATTRQWANIRAVAYLVGGLAVGYVGAKGMMAATSHLLSLHFVQLVGTTPAPISLHTLSSGLTSSAKSFGHLLLGGSDAGRLREVYNGLFLALGFGGVIYASWRRLMPRRLILLVGCILATNEVVYVLSGQAQQASTERYLIMAAPAIILAFGALSAIRKRFRSIVIGVSCVLAAINILWLGNALVRSWPARFTADNHLASVQRYLDTTPGTLTYASMDTALPLAYLSGSYQHAPLPFTCVGTSVLKDSTFYARTAYYALESRPHQTVAIILDGNVSTLSSCGESTIIAILGQPSRITQTDDGSPVLIYPNSATLAFHY